MFTFTARLQHCITRISAIMISPAFISIAAMHASPNYCRRQLSPNQAAGLKGRSALTEHDYGAERREGRGEEAYFSPGSYGSGSEAHSPRGGKQRMWRDSAAGRTAAGPKAERLSGSAAGQCSGRRHDKTGLTLALRSCS